MTTHSLQLQLNVHFLEKLEILGFYANKVSIEMVGPMPVTPDLRTASDEQLDRLRLSAMPNEAHAIVIAYEDSPSGTMKLQLQTLNFSHICAMRAEGKLPAVLSASAILVCSDSEELIVHQRSANAATHPNHWHIFGGAFNPTLDTSSGHADLHRTLQRELLEETGLKLSIPENSIYALSKEKNTGFIQWCVLGVPVSAAQLLQLNGNWEGSIHRVPFDQLADFLQKANWVASGKAHILSWLALGAPHTKPNQKFGSYTSLQLFENLIGQQK